MLLMGVGVGLIAVGYFPTQWAAGSEAIPAMCVSIGVVVMIGVVTLAIAMRRMAAVDATRRLGVGFMTAGQRFGATMLIAIVMAFGSGEHKNVGLIWLGIAYVVVTMIETLALVHWNARLESSE